MEPNLTALLPCVNGDSNFADIPGADPWLSMSGTLWAFLTFPTIHGQEREKSTITLGFDGRELFCRLNDPDNRRSLTVPCETFELGILALEAGVQSTPVQWYNWPGKPAAGSKKKVAS